MATSAALIAAPVFNTYIQNFFLEVHTHKTLVKSNGNYPGHSGERVVPRCMDYKSIEVKTECELHMWAVANTNRVEQNIFQHQQLYFKYCNEIKHKWTRTLGAYGPLVLAPVEGVGALWAPCQVCFFLYFFVFVLFCLFLYLFCLFVFFPFCLFVIFPFCLFFVFFVTHHSMIFSVPDRNTGKCSGMSEITTLPPPTPHPNPPSTLTPPHSPLGIFCT